MDNHIKIHIPEVKPIKRIGWATYYEGEIAQKISELFKTNPELWDNKTTHPLDRFKILENIGLGHSRQEVFENITPVAGFSLLTKLLTGNLPTLAEAEVNYHAMGSGITAPTEAQTQLVTETVRKAITTKSRSGKTALYTIFYDLLEAVGSFSEIGLFAGASITPGSGTMWDRSLLTVNKTNIQTFSLDYEDTFVNV